MKKYGFIALLLVILQLPVSAQIKHTWRMGPLTWNDFTLVHSQNERHSFLEYYLEIDNKSVEKEGIEYRYPALLAYTTPATCWVDTNYQTAEQLAFNQCIFDLIEVGRREMELELVTTPFIDYDAYLGRCFTHINDQIVKFEEESNLGENPEVVKAWQEKAKAKLDTIPTYTPSRIEAEGYSIGGSFSGAFKGVTKDLNQYFSNGGGISFNIDFMPKRHYITWGTYVGAARCRDSVFATNWDNDLFAGELLTTLEMYLGYGYTVVNTTKHRLTPFVALGFEGYYVDGDDDSSVGPTGYGWRAGIDYNYKFDNSISHESWDLMSDYYNASHDEFTLNVKLYAAHNNFHSIEGNPQGYSINLQVGLGLRSGNARYR